MAGHSHSEERGRIGTAHLGAPGPVARPTRRRLRGGAPVPKGLVTLSQTTTSSSGVGVTPRRAWRALGVLLIGMFMSLLDATIVNVALPTIRTSLDASEATLSWIISGYALAFGLALIPAGRLGDRYGHKWVFFTGLALFTIASLACGLAQDGMQLIVARVVQGLAGGIYLPAVTAYIQLLFTGRTRGRAFAIMGAVIGVSSALGPLIGGLLIQVFGNTNGWRLVFVVNLPIGIIALIAALFMLPTGSENRVGREVSTSSVSFSFRAASSRSSFHSS